MGVEYRVPIAGNLGLSLFYDLAQVWSTPGASTFTSAVDHAGSLNRRRGKQSIGLGIHYMTPIGPLRFEYGRPVSLETIPFQITRSVLPDGTTPCDQSSGRSSSTSCILSPGAGGTVPTVKQTGRIFLSIGYPF